MNLLADPNVGYLLLTTAMLLVFLALLAPGTGALEAVALIGLLLAGFQMFNLPVNLWALLPVLAAVLLFGWAVRRRDGRILPAAALVLLYLGTAFFYRGENWLPAVNLWLLGAVTLIEGGFLYWAAGRSLRAIQAPPHQNLAGLVGQIGETRSPVHHAGSVYIAGELWSATSRQPIAADTAVRVVERQGFVLVVEALT